MRACEALGSTARAATLHVDDLPVAHRQHLKTLDPSAAGLNPASRPDDLVPDLGELGLHLGSPVASLLDLKPENLTGLVGAVSDGRVLPPQVPVRDTAPFRTVREQRGKRFGITPVERLGSRTKLLDHDLSIATLSRDRAGGSTSAPANQDGAGGSAQFLVASRAAGERQGRLCAAPRRSRGPGSLPER